MWPACVELSFSPKPTAPGFDAGATARLRLRLRLGAKRALGGCGQRAWNCRLAPKPTAPGFDAGATARLRLRLGLNERSVDVASVRGIVV